jgi:hypothetical protein
MFIPKRYGESGNEGCPFCGKQATSRNEQDIPVCKAHTTALLNEMKCICGEYLETCTGKWGLYFRCQRCGNVNKRKVFEINQVKDVSKMDLDKKETSNERSEPKKSYFSEITEKKERKEITITSRDTEWCD